MLKVICSFESYTPWSGAEYAYNRIVDAGKLEELESYLEDLFPDGIEEIKLNDLLWFDGDQVLKDLGVVELPDEVDFYDSQLGLNLKHDTEDEVIEERIRDELYDDYEQYPVQFTWKINDDRTQVNVYNIEW